MGLAFPQQEAGGPRLWELLPCPAVLPFGSSQHLEPRKGTGYLLTPATGPPGAGRAGAEGQGQDARPSLGSAGRVLSSGVGSRPLCGVVAGSWWGEPCPVVTVWMVPPWDHRWLYSGMLDLICFQKNLQPKPHTGNSRRSLRVGRVGEAILLIASFVDGNRGRKDKPGKETSPRPPAGRMFSVRSPLGDTRSKLSR